MTLMVRSCTFLFLLFLIPLMGFCQDLYDLSHSLKYAGFLSNSRNYSLASEEYERILFQNSDNDSIKHLLLRNYILSGEYEKAIQRTNDLFTNTYKVTRPIALDYSYALLMSGRFDESSDYINAAPYLSITDRNFLSLNRQLLMHDFESASKTIEKCNISDPAYTTLFADINNIPHKSYALGLGMSAIVPGTGKIYSGEWKDGLVSLVFVTGFTIQAIRGYNTYGERSGHFIAYASLAGTFYLSNLYGTFKSVKKYNESSKEKIHNRIKRTFISTY